MYLYMYTDDLAYLMKGLGEIRPHETLGPYGVSYTVAYCTCLPLDLVIGAWILD
jgi:hypothetical protein